MTETVFQPRVLSRDGADTLLSAAIGLAQSAVLFGLPSLAVYYFTQSAALAIAAAGALYVLFMMMCVTRLATSAAGICLTRVMGGPKFIPWSEVTAIHEVSRTELIVHGWFWPLFPLREMTPSCTSLGHYRIQFGDKWIYFPPADPKAFMASVGKHLGS